MLKHFHSRWDTVPVTVIDHETTGTAIGKDKSVQVAAVRFERGELVAGAQWFVNPGFPIPAAATEIHKITDAAVADAPTIGQVFADPYMLELLEGAQICAFNWRFDREFTPRFGDDTDRWPWLDPLPIIREIDAFVKGAKRHTLAASCARHGVELLEAHSAEADARAAGELFFKVAPKVFMGAHSLGDVLAWQQEHEAKQWHNFNSWLARQPPREAGAA